ncbi:MAG TPA: chemotaxis protein CheW [Magnetospirillaceae bacterium]|jgi:purine-binding chemotaxis protein CheW
MMDTLIFHLDAERFGIVAADVVEAVRAVMIAALPKAPPIVEGVINFRGRILPVLDIRARFGLPAKPLEPNDYLIIARTSNRVVALRVDRVSDFVSIADSDIVPAGDVPSIGAMVAGVAKLPDGLVIIHDFVAFLSATEAAALDVLAPV